MLYFDNLKFHDEFFSFYKRTKKKRQGKRKCRKR
nr:MAG TPA: hypothetical protein [Caudoviricetes sp.]DAZ16382.1 MAG TPA: hypothetical protein [Caudoviricetes sp.]